MTSKLNTSKTVAAIAAAALCALSGVAQAQDKPLEVKISGQVNRMLVYADDGDKSTVFNADNINSSTRIRFVGEKEFMPGISAGVVWEIEYTSQRSSSIAFGNRAGGQTSGPTFGERKGEAFIKSKQFGTLSLGQGDGANNGNVEIDLSGTSVIQYAGVTDVGGGFRFRNKNAAGAANGPTIASTLNQFDFESRYDRIRYDTPALGPVVLSGSYGNKGEDSVIELGGRVASKVPFGQVAGAFGWSQVKNNAARGDIETWGGSVSFLSDMGFNATLAASVNKDDVNGATTSKDGKFLFAKLGYKTGIHAVSVDYGRGKDQALNGDKATVIGVAYVMTPKSWLEFYAEAKQFDLNHGAARASTISYDQVTFVGAGTRVKF